jgi:hypothetical protein
MSIDAHFKKIKSLLSEYSYLNVQQLYSRKVSISLIENNIVTRSYLKRNSSRNITNDEFDSVMELLINSEYIRLLTNAEFACLTGRVVSPGSVYYKIKQLNEVKESNTTDTMVSTTPKSEVTDQSKVGYDQGWFDARKASLSLVAKRLNDVQMIKSSGNTYERVKKVLGHLISDISQLELPS